MKYFLITIMFLGSVKLVAQTNYALNFDGVDDYVSIPHDNVLNINKVTIEMWLYWKNTSPDADDVNFLIGKSNEQLEIHTEGGGGEHGLRFIPTTSVYIDTEPNVFLSENWYHVAFAYDPSISLAKCYINGVEKTIIKRGDNPLTTAIIQSPNPLRLGVRADDSYNFFGMIDEVRVWNLVRTQQQIQDNKNIELNGTEEGLVAYYKLNEGTGSSTEDNSLNNNLGTIVGASWITDNPLPVELISFDARVTGNNINITWSTASEKNNYGFIIEKKKNTGNWKELGFVHGAGNSSVNKNYIFHARDIDTGIWLFRLRQIDVDGKYKFSKEIEVNVNPLPQTFSINQNYPNPFNPITFITYNLPAVSLVQIDVYNIMGEKVKQLVNEIQVSGSYKTEFYSGDLSSGIYLYHMSAKVQGSNNEFRETKSMILLK